LLSSKKIFNNQTGGLQISTADVNSKGKFKEELIVYSRENGQINIYKYKNNHNLQNIFSEKPYTNVADIDVSFANLDADYRAELLISPLKGAGSLKVFDFSGTFSQVGGFSPYSTNFTGGVNLGQ
ncbi:hypothetical protein KKF29_02575, partial [Patescibacteria group bacterium]|nr:hypothetical protein [Patescibacteria group bacterium]